MNYSKDLAVIDGINERLGRIGTLETLIYIENNTQEFTLRELRSFYAVMTGFRELFAPRESSWDRIEDPHLVG